MRMEDKKSLHSKCETRCLQSNLIKVVMHPWIHPTHHSKRHLDRLSRFCKIHSRDQQTDRQNNRRAKLQNLYKLRLLTAVAYESIASVTFWSFDNRREHVSLRKFVVGLFEILEENKA